MGFGTMIKAAPIYGLLELFPSQKTNVPKSTETVKNWHSNFDSTGNGYVDLDEVVQHISIIPTPEQTALGQTFLNTIASLYPDGADNSKGISVNDINAFATKGDDEETSISVEDIAETFGPSDLLAAIEMIKSIYL
jgi:hypothetical protein